jgi:acyl-CoA thioesterase
VSAADDLARRVAETMLAREGTGPSWDLAIEEAREGQARVAMTIRPDMLNGHGIVHGGMVFALADTAFAYACNSRNQATVAQQASIVFLSPARAGERLIAACAEQALAGRSGVYQVTVNTSDGRPVATFTGLSRTIGGQVIEDQA